MFSFHGGGGYASDFIQANDMRPLADTANFIAVYPQGAIDPEGGTTSWIHKAPTDHDDIFFVEAIIDAMSLEYTIDQSRVYACGYSEGHWGFGVLSPYWKDWRLYGEMLIGAGGGGGIDSGSALLYKPSIGLEFNLNKDFSLQTGIGKVISKEGVLDANTFDVSLVWRFGTPK